MGFNSGFKGLRNILHLDTKYPAVLDLFLIITDLNVIAEHLNNKMDFRKLEGVVWTGCSWLRIGTGGGHLWVR